MNNFQGGSRHWPDGGRHTQDLATPRLVRLFVNVGNNKSVSSRCGDGQWCKRSSGRTSGLSLLFIFVRMGPLKASINTFMWNCQSSLLRSNHMELLSAFATAEVVCGCSDHCSTTHQSCLLGAMILLKMNTCQLCLWLTNGIWPIFRVIYNEAIRVSFVSNPDHEGQCVLTKQAGDVRTYIGNGKSYSYHRLKTVVVYI